MHFVVSQKFPLLHYNKYFENYSVKEQQYMKTITFINTHWP